MLLKKVADFQPQSDWYLTAEQPAPAQHLARPEGRADLTRMCSLLCQPILRAFPEWIRSPPPTVPTSPVCRLRFANAFMQRAACILEKNVSSADGTLDVVVGHTQR